MVLKGGTVGDRAMYEVMVSSPLITNTRPGVLPRKTGFGPVGTTPAMVSPETSMCRVLPLLEGAGLVDKITACESAPGSPVGLGTGTMNWRKVSLQPAATTTVTAAAKSSPSLLWFEIIPVPWLRGILREERRAVNLLRRFIVA